ncbi:MAG: AraC family transcriptional regulator [Schaedlerella sp.]|nr:AraC family transcriptional regulator [Schaedlerella sp.]
MRQTQVYKRVDETGKETVKHGTSLFPIACYYNNLGKFTVDWHWHDELEVAVIEKGSAIVAAGSEKYVIKEGEGFFFNPGVLHSMWRAGDEGCTFHSFVFHPRLVYGNIDSVFYQRYFAPLSESRRMESIHLTPDIPWQKRILDIVSKMWSICMNEQDGYEFEIRSILSEVMFKFWKNFSEAQNPVGKTTRDEDRIKTMLQFIHDNYYGEVTMKMIADSAMVSESECLRCFRRTIGTTPIQYVKQYRIQTAAGLLASTHMKVADIAIQCGFQDISYFTKSFREYKGCVPTEYRRINL